MPSNALSLCLVLALASAVTGCQEEGEPGSLCDWVEEEVPVDETLVHWEGNYGYDVHPGQILELLSVPMRGTLTWNGGGNWADMTPSEGMTGFSSHLTYGGSTVYRRVPGATGDLTLACPATLDFQTSISMRTDDGVLSRLIDLVNERFGTLFDSQDIVDGVAKQLMDSEEIQRAVTANDRANFELVGAPAFDEALVDRHAKHAEFIDRVFSDEEILRFIRARVLDDVYARLRAEAGGQA